MLRARRTLHTVALRAVGFTARWRWVLLSLGLAAVGVVSIWVSIPIVLNGVLAAISVALLTAEWRRHMHELTALDFVDPKGDDYDDVAATFARSARFEMVTANHDHVLLDRVASAETARGSVSASLRDRNYILPSELKAGVRFRDERIKRRDTYNGHLVGLDTNLGLDESLESTDWKFVPARYWDHLSSDIMASKTTLRHGERVDTLGRALYVDRECRPRDYGDSWLLNVAGTSILAITSDRRLVLVSQSVLNESSGGLLAPASGSVEPVDMRGSDELDVAQLVLNAALRELDEEARVPESAVEETAFLGLGRWMEKAAKPEFWSVARLTVDSHDVRRLPTRGYEKPFTKNVSAVRITPTSHWDVAHPETLLEATDVLGLSVPLLVGLRLMAEEVHAGSSAAGELLQRALAGP